MTHRRSVAGQKDLFGEVAAVAVVMAVVVVVVVVVMVASVEGTSTSIGAGIRPTHRRRQSPTDGRSGALRGISCSGPGGRCSWGRQRGRSTETELSAKAMTQRRVGDAPVW